MEKTRGFAALSRPGHSIFAATDPLMYKYLPVDKETAKIAEMVQSGIISYARTRELYNDFFFWWVLCALQGDCMGVGSLSCRFKIGDRWKTYAHCHRYDQSALAILAFNKYHNTSKFVPEGERSRININRGPSKHQPIKFC